jgi:uncharacterized protein
MSQFLTQHEILRLLADHQAQIKTFGVRSLALFGSFVHGDYTPHSDVDLVVQFDTKSFDSYMDLKFFLEDLLSRRVDLVPTDSVKPQLRRSILEDVVHVPGL